MSNAASSNEDVQLDALLQACFLILGLINNISTVVVSTAAKTIAENFDRARDFGVIGTSMVILGLIGTPLAALLSEMNVTFKNRFYASIILRMIGVLVAAGSTTFDQCVVGILILGTMQTVGENVSLCYCKYFNSQSVTAWSSGTGLAGIVGTFGYLILKEGFGHTNEQILFQVALLHPFALVAFHVLEVKRDASFFVTNSTPFLNDSRHSNLSCITSDLYVARNTRINKDNNDDDDDNDNDTCSGGVLKFDNGENGTHSSRDSSSLEQRLYQVRAAVGNWGFCLCFVYVLEYIIQGKFARASCIPLLTPPRWYEKLCFLYQIGVFAARSFTTHIVKALGLIEKTDKVVFAVTFFQLLLFIQWIVTSLLLPVNVEFQGVSMIIVGCCGGVVYVLVYRAIQSSPLSDSNKDLAVNCAAMLNNAGITLAYLFVLLLDHTLWPPLYTLKTRSTEPENYSIL